MEKVAAIIHKLTYSWFKDVAPDIFIPFCEQSLIWDAYTSDAS